MMENGCRGAVLLRLLLAVKDKTKKKIINLSLIII